MNEFEKRIEEISDDLEAYAGKNMGWLVFKEPEKFWQIIEEMTKEFPSRREFLEAMKYVELSFEDGEIKDFLHTTLKTTKDSIEKWLMESATEAKVAKK